MIESFYLKEPQPVRAIQVTVENLSAVAVWCHGKTEGNLSVQLIVDADRTCWRTAHAFVGDWVTLENGSFHIYSDRDFKTKFKSKEADHAEALDILAEFVVDYEKALENGERTSFEKFGPETVLKIMGLA